MPSRTRSQAQLDLFQSQPPLPPVPVVQGAPVPPELALVAQQLSRLVYLGTSSWTFPGWQGIVYDRPASESQLARHGLAAYAQHPLLRAVGIDRTYYAPITAADFAAYATAVPEDFYFLVKAPALCTQAYVSRQGSGQGRHSERNALCLDAAYAAEQIVGPCLEGLGQKLGPLLFQFPPQDPQALGGAQRFAERLHAFLEALPQGPQYAVELRNAELLVPAYAAALTDVGACHCYNVHPRMPALQQQRQRVSSATAPALVVRWMLHAGLGYEAARVRYQPFDRLVDADPASRAAIAAMCLDTARAGRPAYVIANNKAEGSAPLTLFRLAEQMLTQAPPPERNTPCVSPV